MTPEFKAAYPDRRSGRTTRIIDELIQKLFRDGTVQVYDHHISKEPTVTNRLIKDNVKRIIRRLESEHYMSAKTIFLLIGKMI